MVGIIPEAEFRRGTRPPCVLPLCLGRQTEIRLGIFWLELSEKILDAEPGHRLDGLIRPLLVLARVFTHDCQPLPASDLMRAHTERFRDRHLVRLRYLPLPTC